MRFRFLKQKKFFLAVFAVLLIFSYYLTPLGRFFDPAQEGIFFMGSPFWRAGAWLNSTWSGLARLPELRRRMAEQEESVIRLVRENAELEFLRQENRQLRELLGFRAGLEEKVVGASILSSAAFSGQSALVINQGSQSGLREKFVVVAANGALIGKIISTTGSTATVLLTVDSASVLVASLAKNPSVQAIAKGKMGLSLSLEMIPQDVDLEIGDFVVSSPVEENAPAGLVIGKVAAVFYKEGELFKRANLEPVISLSNLRTVGVIIPAQ